MSRVRQLFSVLVVAVVCVVCLGGPASAYGDGDNPPDWCFKTNANGDLPTCTWDGAAWHRSYESSEPDGGAGAGLALLVILGLVAGGAFIVWKVSTARRMARESGMSEGDATAMTLLSDDGFEATYLASNLRPRPGPDPAPAPPASATSAARLRDLKELLDQGLVTQDEYDARRRAIIDSL